MGQEQEKAMTFEQIEEHIKNANLSQFNKPKAALDGGEHDLAGQLQKICGIYKVVRPVLQAVMSFPLVPPSIKSVIKMFIQVMDGICP